MRAVFSVLLLLATLGVSTGKSPYELSGIQRLERSYWVSISLGASLVKGYWAREARVGPSPTDTEVRSAVTLLTGHYGANRLYLIYHHEIPVCEYERLLRSWQAACPADVELVPTFVLKMYDKNTTDVFTVAEMERICAFLSARPRISHVAVYDVLPNRDQCQCLGVLDRHFRGKLIRVGIQPEEPIDPRFSAVVEDDWSALCAGRTNDDWRLPGFGAEFLRKWVAERNAHHTPVAWDLVAVAWDYLPTKQGEYPGYDDARKNMPLPIGRNRLAVKEIVRHADPGVLAGFSSDLFILESNSRSKPRELEPVSFYTSLKKGDPYRGYFSEPLEEIASIYRGMRDGKLP